jgi:hypothetical protein
MNRPPQKREIILESLPEMDFPPLPGRIGMALGMLGSKYAHRPGETPTEAAARGVGYSGPVMPDKGLKDGSCNRTACQLPLLGQEQWTMPSYGRGGTNGKFYYCRECARKFHEADRDFGQPPRCTLEV